MAEKNKQIEIKGNHDKSNKRQDCKSVVIWGRAVSEQCIIWEKNTVYDYSNMMWKNMTQECSNNAWKGLADGAPT